MFTLQKAFYPLNIVFPFVFVGSVTSVHSSDIIVVHFCSRQRKLTNMNRFFFGSFFVLPPAVVVFVSNLSKFVCICGLVRMKDEPTDSPRLCFLLFVLNSFQIPLVNSETDRSLKTFVS